MRYLILILTMLPFVANADSIDFNLTSLHSSGNYNQSNFGVGITKEIDHHWGIKTGFFKNSYNKDSMYFMGRLQHKMEGWAFGFNFGIVTGYDNIEEKTYTKSCRTSRHGNDFRYGRTKKKCKTVVTTNGFTNQDQVLFIAMPTITWRVNKTHAFEIGIVPSFEKNTTSFATLQYQYRL